MNSNFLPKIVPVMK